MTSRIIIEAIKNSRTVLTEVEAKKLVASAGIPAVKTMLASSKADAVRISRKIGYPVALKIVSPEIIHKSDSGGVHLNLENASQTGKVYSEMMAKAQETYPRADILGVAVQKMASPGVEVIMGMSRDPHFGPALMFGLGGVFVETLKDVSFRIVPIKKRDAKQMIKEVKGYPLLKGARCQKPVNIKALENMLVKLSDLVHKTPEIKELDLNPVVVDSKHAMAVDARVILEGST